MTTNNVTPPYVIIGQAENLKCFADPVSTADDRTKTIKGAPNFAKRRILLLDTVLKCRLIRKWRQTNKKTMMICRVITSFGRDLVASPRSSSKKLNGCWLKMELKTKSSDGYLFTFESAI